MTERDKEDMVVAAAVVSFQAAIAIILFFVMFSVSEAAFTSALLVVTIVGVFALVSAILHFTNR